MINVYIPNNRVPRYMKKKKLTELEQEISNSTIIAGDFNILFSMIDRNMQKIN